MFVKVPCISARKRRKSARQYALRERASALGWEISRISQQDSGSGHHQFDREGFNDGAEVGLVMWLVMG